MGQRRMRDSDSEDVGCDTKWWLCLAVTVHRARASSFYSPSRVLDFPHLLVKVLTDQRHPGSTESTPRLAFYDLRNRFY